MQVLLPDLSDLRPICQQPDIACSWAWRYHASEKSSKNCSFDHLALSNIIEGIMEEGPTIGARLSWVTYKFQTSSLHFFELDDKLNGIEHIELKK